MARTAIASDGGAEETPPIVTPAPAPQERVEQSEGDGGHFEVEDDDTEPGGDSTVGPTSTPATGTRSAPHPAPAVSQPEPPPPGDADPVGRRRPGSELTWKNYREAERRAAELDQRVQQYEAALQQQRERDERLAAAITGQRPQEPVPGVDRPYTAQEVDQMRQEDPLAYNQFVAEQAYQIAMQNSQRQQADQLQRTVNSQIDTFKTTVPDYDQAAAYVRERVEKEFETMGLPRIDLAQQPHQSNGQCCVQHALENRAGQAVQLALQTGRNLGEMIYTAARETYGYQGVQAPAPQAQVQRPAQTPQQKVQDSQARSRMSEGSVGNIPGSREASGVVTPTDAEIEAADEATMDRWDVEMPGWSDRALQRGN